MYNYFEIKPKVFTEEGYEIIRLINKNAEDRTVFAVGELIKGISGDSWLMLACIDWMVENKELEYINPTGMKQNHILRRIV